MTLEEIKQNLASGPFAFWVDNRRVSFLLMILILFLGTASLISIPKESSPKIEFGIIQITTLWPGVNPVDMDNLITDEIEKGIEDIEGIKKITSTSVVGFSTTIVELHNSVDPQKVLIEIEDEVDTANLPDDAEDPVVTELTTDNQMMFELIVYGDESLFPKDRLLDAAHTLQRELEGRYGITEIMIPGAAEYDFQILVDKDKLLELGLSLNDIAATIRAYNQNIPLGQYEVDELEYDFRIEGELTDPEELNQIPISIDEFTTVTIGDIATIRRHFPDETVRKMGRPSEMGYNAISLIVNKREWANIFSSSRNAKKAIEDILQRQGFQGLQGVYSSDLSEIIIEDYQTLGSNGRQTLVLVFLCSLLFIGVKESLVATIGIPLSFLVTFVALEWMGLSLNFLTNFSLVLTLWIAIDTFTVIVEAAFENVKLGFNPKTAALMAVRDFKIPLISGTATTIAVFIPLMVLPGVIGKFLAYIPITVFATLVAALFLSLTVNGALFHRLTKRKNRYIEGSSAEKFLHDEDRVVLEFERQGKTPRKPEELSRKQRTLDRINGSYERQVARLMATKQRRRISVLLPVILLIASFVFLSPSIGFTLFPDGDNERFDMIIKTKVWTNTPSTAQWIPYIENVLSDLPELKLYTLTANNNTITIVAELTDKSLRKKLQQRNVFDVEKDVLEDLAFLEREGLTVESSPLTGWPPQSKPVAIKLVADTNDKFQTLLTVAEDFQDYLQGHEGTKNVTVSSQPTPGQFVYTYDTSTLSRLGLTPNDITLQLAPAMNGLAAGSITTNEQDVDIEVLYSAFSDTVSPSSILDTVVTTRIGPVRVSDVISYQIQNAVGEITREDGDILVRVESDLNDDYQNLWPKIQNELIARAKTYQFPEGITYKAGWETQENQDLILATFRWFFIGIFLIFAILVIQFNSFSKPLVILYTVICALLGVNVGLFLTGVPYSMPFAIGFIAVTWLVVINAIILIDRIMENITNHVNMREAILEAARSRLQPIVLTTLTTIIGGVPISFQDEFWRWLGFTIIFWLTAGLIMTLYIVPNLYYIVYAKREEKKHEHPMA